MPQTSEEKARELEQKLQEQAQAIEQMIADSGLTPEELAARVFIEPDTMRKIRKGYQPAGQKLMRFMRKVATEAQIPSRLREEAGHYKEHRDASIKGDRAHVMKVRKIPFIGWAAAGRAVDFEDVMEWDQMITVEVCDPKAIAIRVRGDSMSPKIEEGDVVVVAPSETPQTGNTIVARLKDEGVVCKKFQIIDPVKRTFRLISINPQFEPIERTEDQFIWIYPVKVTLKYE